MKKSIYFDLLSGASGDMLLASIVDLGVSAAYLQKELRRLGIPGLSLRSSHVDRGGLRCCRMIMKWDTPRSYRHLHDIIHLIKKAKFAKTIQERSIAVLDRIADAEASAHGIPRDHVHFHEIGAVDTIVDIVGFCLGIDALGVDAILFSTLTEGYGTITTEHGTMPVPAPATAAIVKGFHLTRLPIPTELLTPTGAAILTTLGTQSLVCPPGVAFGNGNGCGTKVFENHPNFLRATLIESGEKALPAAVARVTVIESDMDHISGEIMGSAAGVLMEEGALDVSWSPVFMKKGRPGYRLTVIASPDDAPRLADLVMLHTRTLGVRFHDASRVTAERESRQGHLMGHRIAEKICRHNGRSFVKAEHDDLAAIAKKTATPVVDVAEKYVQTAKKNR